MESRVVGLSFLHRHNPIDEVFLWDNEGLKVPVPWPDPLYPCLVVNMGSGVSILRVSNSPGYNGFVRQCSSAGAGDSFARLGGTACGGATFLGLARSMTSANTFEEALALAAKGDATKLDKQVSDIYGVDGTRSLGLPADITAVNFGKLVEGDTGMATEADIAASLLKMVVQQSVILARTLAHQQAPNSDRRLPIFFVGGFLDGNDVGHRTIAQSLRLLDHVQAHFLRHADFLGALGAFQVCISASGAEVSSDSDTNDPETLRLGLAMFSTHAVQRDRVASESVGTYMSLMPNYLPFVISRPEHRLGLGLFLSFELVTSHGYCHARGHVDTSGSWLLKTGCPLLVFFCAWD
jgi:type II pantothenate kinase